MTCCREECAVDHELRKANRLAHEVARAALEHKKAVARNLGPLSVGWQVGSVDDAKNRFEQVLEKYEKATEAVDG